MEPSMTRHSHPRPLTTLAAALLLFCLSGGNAAAQDRPVFTQDAATMGQGALSARVSFDSGTAPQIHHHGLVGSSLRFDYGFLERLQAGLRLSYSRNPQVICGSGAGCFNTQVATWAGTLKFQLLRSEGNLVQLGLELDGAMQDMLESGAYGSVLGMLAASVHIRPLRTLLFAKAGVVHKRAMTYEWTRNQPVAVLGGEAAFEILDVRSHLFAQAVLSGREIKMLQGGGGWIPEYRVEAGLVAGLGVSF